MKPESWSGWFHLSFRRPAPVSGYIASSRTCRANTRTALLEMYMLTDPRHLGNWLTEASSWLLVQMKSRRCHEFVGYSYKLIPVCRWHAPLLARSANTQLVLCGAWSGSIDVTGRLLIPMAGRLVVEVGWRRCCFKDCWECLLFTGARSMGRTVQWIPVKPESWSGCFPIKSSPTCYCRWLHCGLQNVPCEHALLHCSKSTC
jgi:hypothetical protein